MLLQPDSCPGIIILSGDIKGCKAIDAKLFEGNTIDEKAHSCMLLFHLTVRELPSILPVSHLFPYLRYTETVLFFFFHTTWHVELTQSGIEPLPPSMEARSLNHCTTRKVPESVSLNERILSDTNF